MNTHKHSKTISRKDSGYHHMNKRAGGSGVKVAHPHKTLSMGKGRHEAGNNTSKNHA